MKKVITYGTYDLLHVGHINLLRRAKALGDYLIVGVTTDNFDINRGKLNVQQTIAERMQAVKDLGIADEVIPEEYIGQKIDDIRNYNIDIFTVGSDWVGKFDYLSEYCEVVYLPRTEGISSTDIRIATQPLRIGIIGYLTTVPKFISESKYISNVSISGIFITDDCRNIEVKCDGVKMFETLQELFDESDAVYITTTPQMREFYVFNSLNNEKHVLCESPMSLSSSAIDKMFLTAENSDCILFEAIKTAYSLAFSRLVLLAKSGEIGDVKSVESTCTSLSSKDAIMKQSDNYAGSLTTWGAIAALPIFAILGVDYDNKAYVTYLDRDNKIDLYTKVEFLYNNAIASMKVGIGVKSEGELLVSGTKGYIYVPAPWWKTDYFEVRYENPEENKRHFYKLDGEGIRGEIAAFEKMIRTRKNSYFINRAISIEIGKVMEEYYNKESEKKQVFW
ncbi:MAG: adenylyltransferase/cytidyltransferase family protein [Peptococcales bacterium]